MQLREYFDAGVERISVEDVIAQAKVSEGGVRPLHMKRSFKPAWAAAGAFVVTLVGIGGLASVLKLTPRIAGDVDAGAGEIVDASGSTIVVWLIAAVVAAVVAGLTVWLVHRSSKPSENEEEIEPDQGKVTVMETIERTETETTQKTEQRSRWPIVVSVVMAIALVGLIAWMTLAMRPNSPTAAPPEIQQLMEDYSAAWNAYDADALEGLVTVNYRIHSNLTDYDMEDVRAYMLTGLEGMDWHVTTEGPYYAVEGSTGTWYVSSEGSTVNRTGKDYGHNGVWKVIDERVGGPLVVEHYLMDG
jgi:flagellar basal body-associated protein FliL